MFETLLLLGVACVVAAIVGGGLKIAKVAEIPLIDSIPRQALLGLAGAGLIVGSFWAPEPKPNGPNGNGGGTAGEPTITLSEATGPPGASLRVGGMAFAANEPVRIRFHTQELAVVRADANGKFGGATIVIPKDWTGDGSFNIIATGERSGGSASQTFEVPPAAIELSPESGPRGSRVRVTGSGFSVGESVEIELHLEQLAKVKADGEGRISTAVKIPSDWPFDGQFDMRATGSTSRRTARATFRVS